MAHAVLLEPGQVFAGRYKIIRLIAPGGMGAVFEARHLGTERHVALKLLWPHVLAVESAREKFELEAKVAARVQSEHIVHVLDAGFDAESHTPYLVMELLRGSTLALLVEREGAVGAATTVALLEQVARGLDAAHALLDERGRAAPIIHRDLKPENLLLCERAGDEKVIKILDFGIAKVLSESRNMSHEVRGTPMYMAYEQVVAGPLSPQTDVWALGLIAYFLLTGRRFWKSASDPNAGIQALFAEIVTLPIPSARERMHEQGLQLGLPDAFDIWLERCLSRTPHRRFESAGTAVIALEAALRGVAPAGRAALGQTLPDSSQPASIDAAAPPARAANPPERFGRRTQKWEGSMPSAPGSQSLAALPSLPLPPASTLNAPASAPRSAPASLGSSSVLSVPAIERRLVPGAEPPRERRWLLASGIALGMALLVGLALLLRPSRDRVTAASAVPAAPAAAQPAPAVVLPAPRAAERASSPAPQASSAPPAAEAIRIRPIVEREAPERDTFGGIPAEAAAEIVAPRGDPPASTAVLAAQPSTRAPSVARPVRPAPLPAVAARNTATLGVLPAARPVVPAPAPVTAPKPAPGDESLNPFDTR